GLGVSYEELSGDLSNANYSSLRARQNTVGRYMLARKTMVADAYATAIYRLWLEEAVNTGPIETMKGRHDWREGMNKAAYSQCEWLGAARGQIDEQKETQAAILRMGANLSTLEDELGKQGKDWRAVIKQRAKERAALSEAGLNDPP